MKRFNYIGDMGNDFGAGAIVPPANTYVLYAKENHTRCRSFRKKLAHT